MIAKTAYFYGWTLEYVKFLPTDDFFAAWKAITVIEAQDVLMEMRLSDYPMMNKSDRKAFKKDIEERAYPRSLKNKKRPVVKTSDLAAIIRNR